LRDDYVPTGWKGYGLTTRAVRGHEFGLKLSVEDSTPNLEPRIKNSEPRTRNPSRYRRAPPGTRSW
jgi:hypothetical protein